MKEEGEEAPLCVICAFKYEDDPTLSSVSTFFFMRRSPACEPWLPNPSVNSSRWSRYDRPSNAFALALALARRFTDCSSACTRSPA